MKLTSNANNKYSEKKLGIYGTLGSGTKTEVEFVQVQLTEKDLNNVKLVSDIPESAKWSVQNLFQRAINKTRVKNSLIPYLEDDEHTKFFNPITLIVLPHKGAAGIDDKVPFLQQSTGKDMETEWNIKSHEGYYQFWKIMDDNTEFGQIRWNPNNCHIVAIDGQHRVCALKELNNQADSKTKDWKVPAVILSIGRLSEEELTDDPSIIEEVRKIFIDINNKSQRISDARKIILNDSLALDVACQEIIEFAHNEEIKTQHANGEDQLRLELFDWRGDQGEQQSNYASIISVVELNKILNAYFEFPKDDEDESMQLPKWLKPKDVPSDMLDKDSKALRENLMDDFTPSWHVLLSKVKSFENYSNGLKRIFEEQKEGGKGDYFLEMERYGSASNKIVLDIDQLACEKAYREHFKESVLELKSNNFPELLLKDIGRRALFYVFSQKQVFDELLQRKSTWVDHAGHTARLINKLIDHKWFTFSETGKLGKALLPGIAVKSDGTITGYKIEDVKKGYGSLILLLCITNSLKLTSEDDKNEKYPVIESLLEDLKKLYLKHATSVEIAELRPGWKTTDKELRKAAKNNAEKKIKTTMQTLRKLVFGNYDKFLQR